MSSRNWEDRIVCWRRLTPFREGEISPPTQKVITYAMVHVSDGGIMKIASMVRDICWESGRVCNARMVNGEEIEWYRKMGCFVDDPVAGEAL